MFPIDFMKIDKKPKNNFRTYKVKTIFLNLDFVSNQISRKANLEDLHSAMSAKVDTKALKNQIDMKASISDLEQVRLALERVMRETDMKCSIKGKHN
jgi:hypothetical protein